MAKKEINTLFVDIGGVLLSNGWDHVSRKKSAEHFGIDYDQMQSRHALAFDTYEVGKLSLDDYLNRTVFYEPRSFSHEDFREFMYAQSRPYIDMIELVKQYKKEYGLKVVAVSNEGRELALHRINQFALNQFIDFFIVSSFVHLRKPDTDIYRLALDVSQVPPDQIVYLEDRPLLIEVARGLGIHAVHHSDVKSTKRVLTEFFEE